MKHELIKLLYNQTAFDVLASLFVVVGAHVITWATPWIPTNHFRKGK